MFGLVLTLLFLAIVCAFSPVLISVCTLLLTGRRPLANAIAYAIGVATVLIIGGSLLFWFFGDNLRLFFEQPALLPMVSILLGGSCLALALRSYLRVPEHDAPPPEWLEILETIQPWKAALLGLALAGTNLKLLIVYSLGLWAIVQANLPSLAGVLFLCVFSIGVMAGVLAPIAIRIARPQRSAELLDRLRQQLGRLARPMAILTLGVLGAFLAVRGLSSVLS